MIKPVKMTAVRQDREHEEQVVFMQWCQLQEKKFPELKLMFAIPNGGQRSVTTASKLKKEGVKAGIPDLHLPVARGEYNSLFIEMKVGKNRPTAHQMKMMELLTQAGNYCVVCYGAKEAIEATQSYLML
jgi:hypothetical protein